MASRALKYSAIAVLLLLAAVVVLVLPSAPEHVNRSAPDPLVVKGAIHIHTIRSDGSGTVDDVAGAAAAAGLAFVVVTDHGDGRRIEPPSYRSGVLVLDGAEVSVTEGHVLAIGARAAEYPLGGEAADAIEDIHRLGGMAVAAHPTSPKRDLAWRAWETNYDGLEWLNADSEWRDESAAALARLALGYWFRPAAAVARTFDRPESALRRADEAGARRTVVLVAGHDAHARIGKGTEDEPGSRSLPLPSYRAVFRSFALRAMLDAPFTGQAENDAAALLRALRHGRVFTAIDGLAAAGRFAFSLRSGGATASIGDRLIPGGNLRADVVSEAPEGARIVVLGNGREVASGPPPRLQAEFAAVPGPYRVEVRLDGSSDTAVPWIVSSPIFVGLPPPVREPAVGRDAVAAVLTAPDAAEAWTVEHSAESQGATVVSNETGSVQFTFTLGKDPALSPYAAAVRRVDASGASAIEVRIRADRPMRVSVQVRSPTGGKEGKRWRKSVYATSEERLVRLSLADFRPVPPVTTGPELSTVDSLLFVVDLVNSDPGAVGEFTLTDVRLVR